MFPKVIQNNNIEISCKSKIIIFCKATFSANFSLVTTKYLESSFDAAKIKCFTILSFEGVPRNFSFKI